MMLLAPLAHEAAWAAAEPAHARRRLDDVAPLPFPPDIEALAAVGCPPGPLLIALTEANRTGVAPFDALMASGAFAEDDLVALAARAFGVASLGSEPVEGPGIDADACAMALRTGVVKLADFDGEVRTYVAARERWIGRLAVLARAERPPRSQLTLVGPRAFADLVVARAGAALAERASEGPARLHPELSVTGGVPQLGAPRRWAIVALAGAFAASTFLFNEASAFALAGTSLIFAVLNAFRLFVVCTAPEPPPPPVRRDDRDLPVYTVLAPLAREGAVVPDLLRALEALDYPRAKLDIKLLVEAGDRETLDALERRPPRAGIEVLRLPPGGPQTKPRALNAGLLGARGRFVTVFDAEDEPDPGQLRAAVEAFRRGPASLACVQARLAIDNLGDGWLARQFAIEYAALFDVVVPALAARGLPIALGGTSNHFDVETLRRVGGWDPWNVTEDADLGLRLARLGYTVGAIASTTWEEAPARPYAWLKQRTRWMKGFMVTSLVHGRSASGFQAATGAFGAVASLMLVGGVALTALAYPCAVAGLTWRALDGSLLRAPESWGDGALSLFCGGSLVLGYAASLACGWIGVDRRNLATLTGDLVTMPLYWLLVGAAAWRALYQIALGRLSDWEKTTHGVSRRRARPAQM